jgi:hypothetical protein
MRVLSRNYLLFGLWIALSFLFAKVSVIAQPSNVVTVASEAALRDAMAMGGLVRCSFDGTITLSNAIDVTLDVTLDAQGHSVVISGNKSNRIFTVESGVTFSATNVVFANGRHVGQNGQGADGFPGQGGAIFSVGGTVQLVSCALLSNSVTGGQGGAPGGIGGKGQGGAIFLSGGSLLLDSVMVSSNTASGGPGPNVPLADTLGGNGQGGAIYVAGGPVLISNCILSRNICIAPTGEGGNPVGKGAGAFGGALFQESGSVTFTNSTIAFNQAFGSNTIPFDYARPGAAYGGAMAVSSGTTTVTRCTLISNLARGGDAFHFSGTGEAQGGAIYSSATFRASESTFASNQALSGGGSNTNTDGRGGAIYNSGLAVLNGCSLISNRAIGGNGLDWAFYTGNPGGHGLGGAVFNTSQLVMTNCTAALNLAQGGEAYGISGGPGGVVGTGAGGGVYDTSNGVFTAVNVTIASNSVSAVAGGFNWTNYGFADGANIAVTNGTIWLRNSILAYPNTNHSAWGTITDGEFNISSDGSANFNSGSSFNFTDPLLQGLADNGGPTLTMALPPDTPVVWWPGQGKGPHHTSPAVDFGTAIGAPTTDQRGFARPSGLRVDTGAYELQAPPIQRPLLTQSRLGEGQWLSFQAQWAGTYVLQKSTNLSDWTDTEVVGPFGGDTQVNLTNNVSSSKMEFFRLRIQ